MNYAQMFAMLATYVAAYVVCAAGHNGGVVPVDHVDMGCIALALAAPVSYKVGAVHATAQIKAKLARLGRSLPA